MDVVGGIAGKSCYYALHRWSTGIIFRPAANPDGADVPGDVMEGILIRDDMPRIPKECWTAMIRLFIYCVEKDPRGNVAAIDANNEVCVVFAANYTTGEVVVAAMPQVVGPARVVMDRTRGACNLITGEYYNIWPPPGYAEIGDCHSHNRMGAFFSGVDDNDDRALPGIHMVCGAFNRSNTGGWEYRIASSIVADKMRFQKTLYMDGEALKIRKMEYTDLVSSIEWAESVTLHPDVLNHVHIDYPADWKPEKAAIIIRPNPQDWYKNRPDSYENWPQDLKDKFEKWRETGTWGDDTPNSSRGAERKADESNEKSLINEYYDAVFKDTNKDLPGQTMLFEVDFDDTGDLVMDGPVDKTILDDLRWVFRDFDASIEFLLTLMPTDKAAFKLLAKYLNSWGVFNPVSVKKKWKGGDIKR